MGHVAPLKTERSSARRRAYGPLVAALILALLAWIVIAFGGKLLSLWLT